MVVAPYIEALAAACHEQSMRQGSKTRSTYTYFIAEKWKQQIFNTSSKRTTVVYSLYKSWTHSLCDFGLGVKMKRFPAFSIAILTK